MGRGIPLPRRLEYLGEHRKLLQLLRPKWNFVKCEYQRSLWWRVFHWLFCHNSTVVVPRGRGSAGKACPRRTKDWARRPHACPPQTAPWKSFTISTTLLLARVMGQYCFARWRLSSSVKPVHTSNTVEATLSNATMSNVASTLLLVLTGLNAARWRAGRVGCLAADTARRASTVTSR